MTDTHQVAITVITRVRDGAASGLDAALAKIAADTEAGRIAFGRLPGLHFARMVVIPPAGQDAAQLMLLLDCDAPERKRLRQFVTVAGAGLDAVFECCEGYPAEADRSNSSRYVYLRRHAVRAAACYVNTVGRTVAQIREEARLREEIEAFLDCERGLAAMGPGDARAAIQRFVDGREDLRWANEPAAGPSLGWRIANKLDLARGIAIGLAFAPIAFFGAIPYAIQLRRLERSDPAPRVLPDDEHVRRLAEIEDLVSQNQFTAYGELKPGRFRRYTAIGLLWAVNFGARHRFNRGNLAGVKTIHAARWVFLDDKRRVAFFSNYDGSLENYMDDFIDKVAWGLNAVFSNGREYPRTNWLIKGGAKDEMAFKSYIRAHQLPSNVWYTAYPNLTGRNIDNNARIRAGLNGEMTEAEAAAWLRRI